jgi:TatD DNase family protein
MSTKKRPSPLEFHLPPVGVDTHAHLDLPQFRPDLDEVLQRARQCGLRYLINVFLGPDAYAAGRDLFSEAPEVSFALGVHPHEADGVDQEVLSRIEAAIRTDQRIKAVGEIGLDLFHNRSPEAAQVRAFEDQLRMARDNEWPVVIHSREATEQTLDILQRHDFSGRPLLWHCFGGDAQLAREVVAQGWLVSIPGTVSYKKAEGMRQAVRELPLDRIVLETDCPFLSPEPYRGRRNEPAYTVFTAKALAEATGWPIETVWQASADNAIGFFKLDGDDQAAR